VYNLTSTGEPVSWADVARAVFHFTGHDPARITPVSTAEYFASSAALVAPRPRNSVLDLARITRTAFEMPNGSSALERYIASFEQLER
jgi:dTDP-4-dehydrorhamnose 3,5-epimerase